MTDVTTGPFAAAAPRPGASNRVRILSLADGADRPLGGRGTATVDGETLTLEGPVKGVPLLTFPRPREARRYPLSDVLNVAQDGRLVSFDLVRGDLIWSRSVLLTEGDEEAARLASALPARGTERFVLARAAGGERAAAAGAGFVGAIHAATPVVFLTPALIVANLLAFAWMMLRGVPAFGATTEQLLAAGANHWPLTTSGQWWRLLSSAFLHGDLLHLAFNCWALYAVGMLAERLFGRLFFGLVYLASAVVASLASVWWNQAAVSVGASGAVFGIFGAMLAYLAAQHRIFPRGAVRALARNLLIFVALNVYLGLASPNVDNAAHIGGLLTGLAVGFFAARPLELRARSRQTVPRLGLTLAAALALGAGAVAAVPRAGPDAARFADVLRAFAQDEDRMAKDYRAWASEAEAGRMTPQALADRIERELVASWQRHHEAFASLRLGAGSRDESAREVLSRYTALRRDAAATLARALREGDEQAGERAAALTKEADALLEGLEDALQRGGRSARGRRR